MLLDLKISGSKIVAVFMASNIVFFYMASWVTYAFLMYNSLLELDIEFIVFSSFAVSLILSTFFWKKIHALIKNTISLAVLSLTIVGLSTILFSVVRIELLLILILIAAGFFSGTGVVSSIYYFKEFIPIEHRGKFFGLLMVIYAISVIEITYLSVITNSWVVWIILGGIAIALGLFGFLIRTSYIMPGSIVKEENYQRLQKKDLFYYLVAVIVFGFTLGIAIWQMNESSFLQSIALDAGAILIGDSAYTASGPESATWIHV